MRLINEGSAFRKTAWQWSLIVIFFLTQYHTYSEEVCKVFYNGYPEDINGKEITVPEKTVALSEKVRVGTPTQIVEGTTQSASIFFVIDHSGSMDNEFKDKEGYRFTVPFTLMDTIQKTLPNAEVGISVFQADLFFYEKDSPYFAKTPQWDRAYLPLMKLDSTYNNNETGYDIVKKYLDSELINRTAQLKYQPSVPIRERTNINCAFDAAKHAMLSSKYSKNEQYIIFFSDGEANEPDQRTKDNYTKGVDVPTTFTIFFSRNGFVPASIQLMTNNIKNNGYSDINNLTRCWGYENTTKDSLMNFLLENVFKSIFTKRIAEPQKITVNNTIDAKNWDGNVFTFPDMFPLTGITTDFSQTINYTINVDSIMKNESVSAEEIDTSISVGFTVKIDDNAPKQEILLFECWDRELHFFHNNTPITLANETMDELELRFKEDKVDILYGYENITVDIINKSTKKTDLETFKLEDKGSYFTYTFKREITSEPEHGDTKLGHAPEDSIIAIFRNPDLPLDSIRYGIPFRISSIIELKKGYYYDNNADGYIDSLFLEFKGEVTNSQAKELVDFITLPPHRGFETISINVYSDGIGLTVRQKDAEYDDRMVTHVTEEDVLVIKDGFLPSGGLVYADTVEIVDKVAPIIMKAHLINYEDPQKTDTLTVTFSEPILKVTKHKPFYFWSSDPEGLLYIGDLRLIESSTTTMTFEIQSINGVTDPVAAIHREDSLWIYWEDNQVGDNEFNYQHNKNNRRRNLDIEQKYLDIILVAKGTNPYDRNNPENHFIPSQILNILKNDNIADIQNSAPPNGGMLLRVTPQMLDNSLKKTITDFFLEGTITIFDAVGNTVIKNREMGYHDNSKSLNFVWNGRNSYSRTCGAGPYLALFKVDRFAGPAKMKMEEKSLTLTIIVK